VGVCVCVCFVMCRCFGNMCNCIYCVSVLFRLCIFILFGLLFNFVSYVFLFVIYLFIFIVMCVLFCLFCFHRANWHSSAPWLRFSPTFSSFVKEIPGYNSQRWCTALTLPKLIVLFYVFFVWKCVLYPSVRSSICL
jgi:uncharacterized membrane protein